MRCFRTRNLLLSKKCVPLHCVFHSIRFKVNKGWSTAVLLFLCPYTWYAQNRDQRKNLRVFFFKHTTSSVYIKRMPYLLPL